MSWGATFKNVWSGATDAAKQAASEVASGTRWLGQQANDTYEWSKDQAGQAADWSKQQALKAAEWTKQKAVDAAEFAKQKAVEAADWTKQKAVQAKAAMKSGTRDAIRFASDKGYDAISATGEQLRKDIAHVQAAYDKVKSLFGDSKPTDSVVACPLCAASPPDTDKEADGWFTSPNEKDAAVTSAYNCAYSTTAATARGGAVVSNSACCRQKRAAGQPARDIVYVNGIKTSRQDHCETLHAIAQQTCARVIGIYNATEGAVLDATQTGQDRRLIKAANHGKAIQTRDGRNPAVDSLSKFLVQENREGRKPEIWAHSQGGAVTSLALIDANNTLVMETGDPSPLTGTKVTSLASAAPTWIDGPDYEHYVHVNDLVPTSFGLGHDGKKDAKNAGKRAKVIRFSGDPTSSQAFNNKSPETDWVPEFTANHGVSDTYLRMEKQKNGGCP